MRNSNYQVWRPRASEIVLFDGDKLVTDSVMVAKVFGKAHKDVLRAYDNLRCSAEFNQRNFAPVEFIDAKGEARRSVRMSKDGFTMLAMGFTGQKAMEFKEAYINAFNEMAETLAENKQSLWHRLFVNHAKEATSKAKASFGSHLMLERKREIPPLRDERHLLEEAIQPSFPGLLN